MKTVIRLVCLLSLAVLWACASNTDRTSRPQLLSIGAPPADERTVLNNAKLRDAPLAVQQAFVHDYPDARVVNVNVLPAATNQLVYEIVFVENGQPFGARYSADGQPLTAPRQD